MDVATSTATAAIAPATCCRPPPSATFCHLPFAARRPLNACLLLRAESGKDARFNAAHPDVQQRLPDDVRIPISIIFTHK